MVNSPQNGQYIDQSRLNLLQNGGGQDGVPFSNASLQTLNHNGPNSTQRPVYMDGYGYGSVFQDQLDNQAINLQKALTTNHNVNNTINGPQNGQMSPSGGNFNPNPQNINQIGHNEQNKFKYGNPTPYRGLDYDKVRQSLQSGTTVDEIVANRGQYYVRDGQNGGQNMGQNGKNGQNLGQNGQNMGQNSTNPMVQIAQNAINLRQMLPRGVDLDFSATFDPSTGALGVKGQFVQTIHNYPQNGQNNRQNGQNSTSILLDQFTDSGSSSDP